MTLTDDFSSGVANLALWADLSGSLIRTIFTGRQLSLLFSGAGFRVAQTRPLNTQTYQSLEFDLIDGDGINNGGSRNDVSISLQYSTDNGTIWTTIQTYASLTQWTQFRINLPLAAQTTGTLIRWAQDNGDGNLDLLASGSQEWGLDNISLILSYTPGSTTINGVNLGFTAQGDYAIKNGSDFAIPVILAGKSASPAHPGANWKAIAAAASGSSYQLFWQNSVSKQIGSWLLDGTGNYIAGSATALTPLQTATYETQLNVDLDQDTFIGPGYNPGRITLGSVNLGTNTLGDYALRNGTAAPITITFNNKPASDSNPGANWKAIAAAASGSSYQLFWQNSVSKQIGSWLLDGTGNYIAGSGTALTPLEVFSTETALNLDLDKDGITGLPLLPIARVGDVTLGEITQGALHYGFAVRRGQSAALPVRLYQDGPIASYSNPGSGWEPAAASSSGEGFQLYWHNHATNTYAVWNLAANASLASGAYLGGPEVIAAERLLGIDISHNGVIGTL